MDQQQYIVQGTYKSIPSSKTIDGTVVTLLDPQYWSQTLLPLDDHYFANMLAVMYWACKLVSQGPTQETMQAEQLADQALYVAATKEGVALGANTFAPSEPLVGGRNIFPNSYSGMIYGNY